MLEKLVAMLKELEEVEDAYFYESEGVYNVDINDFEGFDENWDEVDHEFVKPQLVEYFINWLEENASSKEGDFYVTYHFNGFAVQLGYTSYDI